MSSRAWSNVPIGLAAIAGLLLAAAQAQNETLTVQARIGEACTVTSALLDFGQDLDLDAANGTNATGAIDISCAAQTPLNVQLDGGIHGQFGARNMSDGESTISYSLYKDSARLQDWVAGDQVPATITGTGSVPVYGRVPQQTNGHAAGLYTDEVTITLVF